MAKQLSRVFLGREKIRISVPRRCAEIRVKELDPSVGPEDVRLAIAKGGRCEVEDVRVGQLKRTSTGRGSLWAKCPIEAARWAAGEGKLRIGWGMAKVEPLKPRPIICYRCLRRGHAAAACKAEVDRSSACFRCS